MTHGAFQKLMAVPLSVWLPIANIPRVLKGDPRGRVFAVGVAGLRRHTSPPLVHFIQLEQLASFLGYTGDCITVNFPGVDRLTYDRIGGGTGADRLIRIAFLLQLHQSRYACEIGTFVGNGSIWIANNLHSDGRLDTIDLPLVPAIQSSTFSYEADSRIADYQGRANRIFHGLPVATKIRECFGDSMTFDFAALDTIYDFFYIDGNHALPNVVRDTLNAFEHLSDDGFVVWDDFLPYHLGSHPDVATVVELFNKEIDSVYDIGGQAVWFARKSSFRPRDIKARCVDVFRARWPRLF